MAERVCPNAADLVEIDLCFDGEVKNFMVGDLVHVHTMLPGSKKPELHLARVRSKEGTSVELEEDGRTITWMSSDAMRESARVDDNSFHTYLEHYDHIYHCGHSASYAQKRKMLILWKLGDDPLDTWGARSQDSQVLLFFKNEHMDNIGVYCGEAEELLFNLRTRTYELVTELADEVLLWMESTETYANRDTTLADACGRDGTGIIIVQLRSCLRAGSRVLLVGPGARCFGRHIAENCNLILDSDESSLLSGNSDSEQFILFFPFEVAHSFVVAHAIIMEELKKILSDNLDGIHYAMKWQRIEISVETNGHTIQFQGAASRKLAHDVIRHEPSFKPCKRSNIIFPYGSGSMPRFTDGSDKSIVKETASISCETPIFLGYLDLIRKSLYSANIPDAVVSYKDLRSLSKRTEHDKQKVDYDASTYAKKLDAILRAEKEWNRIFDVDPLNEKWPIREEGIQGRDPHGEPFTCVASDIVVWGTTSRLSRHLVAWQHFIVEEVELNCIYHMRFIPEDISINESTPRAAVAHSYNNAQRMNGRDINRTTWTPKPFIRQSKKQYCKEKYQEMEHKLIYDGLTASIAEVQDACEKEYEKLLRQRQRIESRLSLWDPQRICRKFRGIITLKDEGFYRGRFRLREAGPLITRADFLAPDGGHILSGMGPVAGLVNLLNTVNPENSIITDVDPVATYEYGVRSKKGLISNYRLEPVFLPLVDEEKMQIVDASIALQRKIQDNFKAGENEERFQSVVRIDQKMIKRRRDPLEICFNGLPEVYAIHQVPLVKLSHALRQLSTLTVRKVNRCSGCEGCVDTLNEIYPGLATMHRVPDMLVFAFSSEYAPIEKEWRADEVGLMLKDIVPSSSIVDDELKGYTANLKEIIALTSTGYEESSRDKADIIYNLGLEAAAQIYNKHTNQNEREFAEGLVFSLFAEDIKKLKDDDGFLKLCYHAGHMIETKELNKYHRKLFLRVEKNSNLSEIRKILSAKYIIWSQVGLAKILAHARTPEEQETLTLMLKYLSDLSSRKTPPSRPGISSLTWLRSREIFKSSQNQRRRDIKITQPNYLRLTDEFAEVFTFLSSVLPFEAALTYTVRLWGKPVKDLDMPQHAHEWSKHRLHDWDENHWGHYNIKQFCEAFPTDKAESILETLFHLVIESVANDPPSQILNIARDADMNLETFTKKIKESDTHREAQLDDIEDVHAIKVGMKIQRQVRMFQPQQRSLERRAEIDLYNGKALQQVQEEKSIAVRKKLSEERPPSYDVLLLEHAIRMHSGLAIGMLTQEDRLNKQLTAKSMEEAGRICQGNREFIFAEQHWWQGIWEDVYASKYTDSSKHSSEILWDAVCNGASSRNEMTGNNLKCKYRLAKK